MVFAHWFPSSMRSSRRESVEYGTPPQRPSTPFDTDLPPPLYERVQGEEREQRSQRMAVYQNTCLAFIINCVLLCVAYMVFVLDWYLHTYDCQAPTAYTVTGIIGVSSFFYFIQAMVVTLIFYYTSKKEDTKSAVYGAIIMISSAISFVFSVFSSLVLLMVVYFNFDEKCLQSSQSRLFATCWTLSLGSSCLNVIFLVRSAYVTYTKRTPTPSAPPAECRHDRVYTVELPPSYFEQIQPPPKYAP